MHDSVSGNFESKLVVLFLGGQDAINEEIGGFKMVRFNCQLLDRVSSESMTSVRMNRASTLGGCPTCNGELELFVSVMAMKTE